MCCNFPTLAQNQNQNGEKDQDDYTLIFEATGIIGITIVLAIIMILIFCYYKHKGGKYLSQDVIRIVEFNKGSMNCNKSKETSSQLE